MSRMWAVAFGIALVGGSVVAQTYVGQNITGQLTLSRTVNVLQTAQKVSTTKLKMATASVGPEIKPNLPPGQLRLPVQSRTTTQSLKSTAFTRLATNTAASVSMTSMAVSSTSTGSGFNGITHMDQRQANNGNQFSIEPPSESVAVANGYVLEGVNNAIQVYNTAGAPLLPQVLATNQLFGLPAAIDRTTGVNGVYPTDMRVFFDQTINRWIVLQRAQDNDAAGNPLTTSHLYIAVSQTADPTGVYNIYTMNTTHADKSGCPCIADYPQIGADQNGFYISVNEFNSLFNQFVNASILAISKASLLSGVSSPVMTRFVLPFTTGYEFAIQPATTPTGGSYFVANGGVEYLVSTNSSFSVDSNLAIWAISNTSSLGTATPSLTMMRTNVATLTYTYPDVATQRPGSLPYGSLLIPSGVLSYIDGGDLRVQSLVYSGGRLYTTINTQVTDEAGKRLVGGAYVILSPTIRSGALAAPVLRQGYLMVKNNHLLRPAVAITAAGKGAITFTLVGPDYYPSAAFVPIDTTTTGSTVQIAGVGVLPEDGFTGYGTPGFAGISRWGDYSTAVVGSDGAIWMVTQYIPNAPRSEKANWGTFLMRYMP